jgi:hypothetical protein
MLAVLNDGSSYITDRQQGDFTAVGATSDVDRECVAQGQKQVRAANASLTLAKNASHASKGIQSHFTPPADF